MLRSMQRGMSGDFLCLDPSTPPLSSRSSSLRKDGDDAELSPRILDLHSFDTELLPEMPVHGASAFGYARGRSFDDSDLSISANKIASKPQAVTEANLLKSFFVDREKSGSVAKIKVVVRKRPLNKREISKKEEDIITSPSSNSLTVHEAKLKVDLTEYVEKHEFVFDAVLDEDVSNDEVYHETVEPIIPTIIQRTKATCFAYGQTDKSRVVRHKRRQESKRSDRKTMRTTLKTRFDSFMSKDSMVNAHLATPGNTGTFGAKFDILDATKNMDDLSLSELLDGSYKCPNLCHDKVKKASSVNENILLSVRKAASILTNPSTGCSGGLRKAPGIPSSTDCGDEDEKFVEESAFSNQIQDQAAVSDSGPYQPKDILERLALPASQDLNSTLVDSSLPLLPLKCSTNVRKASLPPFPWSFSNGWSCKTILDTSKSATGRSTSQGRWARIGTSSCLVGEERTYFSELDLKIDDHTGDLRPQHCGDHSPSMETVKLHDRLSFNVQICMPHDANAITKPINMTDILASKKGPSALSSYDHFNPMAMNMDLSDAYQLGSKESAILMDMETEGILQQQGNESNSVNQSISNLQIQATRYTEEENRVKDVCRHNGKDYYYQYNSTMGGTKHCLLHLPTPEGSNSDYSPRLLAAAAILCDIASTRKRNHNSGKATLPSSPSQTAAKVRKSRPLIGKMDGPKLAAKNGDPTRRTNRMGSPEHKPIIGGDKSEAICANNVGQGPPTWPVPTENTCSTKFGRESAVKPLQSSPVGLVGQTPPLTRAERVYDGHRKHRSTTAMTTSVNTAGIYVKDWGKGRHRRE